jgi:hypothetical protein
VRSPRNSVNHKSENKRNSETKVELRIVRLQKNCLWIQLSYFLSALFNDVVIFLVFFSYLPFLFPFFFTTFPFNRKRIYREMAYDTAYQRVQPQNELKGSLLFKYRLAKGLTMISLFAIILMAASSIFYPSKF